MKKRHHGHMLLSLTFGACLCAAIGTASQASRGMSNPISQVHVSHADGGGEAKNAPHKIVVRFRAAEASHKAWLALTQETGPASLDAETSQLQAIFLRYDVRSITPLFRALRGEVLTNRTAFQERCQRIRQRFPTRAHRAPANARFPDLTNLYLLRMSKTAHAGDCARELAQNALVDYAEPNFAFSGTATPNDPLFGSSGSWGQSFDDLYAPKITKADSAWDLNTGSSSVIIGLVDSGIDLNHPDLSGNLWTNSDEIAGNGADDDGNGFVDDVHGWDFWEVDNDPQDGHGHGTWLGGIAAGVGNNGKGLSGLAWRARLMSAKGRHEFGWGATLANAILYAADNGADVINLAFESWPELNIPADTVRLIEDAIDYAKAMGAICVAAAGNRNINASGSVPAMFSSTITVAATNYNDRRTSWSNYGSVIDVAAPGYQVLGCLADNSDFQGYPSNIINSRYLWGDGTSASSAVVSGIVALLLSHNSGLSASDVRQILRNSADDIEAPGFDPEAGYGRVNAYRALKMGSRLQAIVTAPGDQQQLFGAVNVTGNAYGWGFQSYMLEYGQGAQPSSWTAVTPAIDTPVDDGGLLASWDTTPLAPGPYSLRLIVQGTGNETATHQVNVEVTGAVPVELASFQANVVRDGVMLRWRTETETNNLGFEVERRAAERNFETLGFVPGVGTSSEPHDYSFHDPSSTVGTREYRLRQIDADGAFKYSETVSVHSRGVRTFILAGAYPNPARATSNSGTWIQFNIDNDARAEVALFNLLGQRVRTLVSEGLTAGSHVIPWDGRDEAGRSVPSGVYIIRLTSRHRVATSKLLVVQ